MKFTVIDKKTGREYSERRLIDEGFGTDLMEMDIDQIYVGEDGSMILTDECGRYTTINQDRFLIIPEYVNQIRDLFKKAINQCNTPDEI